MKADSILRGYTTQATAYEVKDYPYGFRLRTTIFYWIETKEGHGDRLGTYTINPKIGRPNKPKYSTYSPFLYLHLDEKGHVVTGCITARELDKFEMRFSFIIDRFGAEYVSQIQQKNIRSEYFVHFRVNYPYEAVKYSELKRPAFLEWVKGKAKHIVNCDFKDLVSYPIEKPSPDNPDGEVKSVVTEIKTL